MLLAILGMAVVASATPLAAEAWEYNREAILHGEWGRLLTGHLTHWNFDHLFWDAATFLLLGVACVWRSVGRTVGDAVGRRGGDFGVVAPVPTGDGDLPRVERTRLGPVYAAGRDDLAGIAA